MLVDVFIERVAYLIDKLDVFCRSFATQDTSASFYSILTYQMKFSQVLSKNQFGILVLPD